MIRYPVEEDDLRQRIRDEQGTWLQRARERTQTLRGLGKYDESSSIWGEIKSVYMRLQHFKCAYCERYLEGEPHGSIEHDLEHFRPKSSAKKWPTDAMRRERGLTYRFNLGDAWDEGYYLLAYDILNYAAACKPCNSTLKSNYFPVYKERGPQTDDCRNLASEQPLLIYPVADIDQDPERLITFDGLVAVPRYKRGYKSYRARVTIEFFRLNDRETLRHERAKEIFILWTLLNDLENAATAAERAQSEQNVTDCLDGRLAHSNCKRAFHALYRNDPARAAVIGASARDYFLRG